MRPSAALRRFSRESSRSSSSVLSCASASAVPDQASDVQDMDQPTFRLHALKGDRKGVWAVMVRANWRVTFRFEGGDAYDVDLEDYH